MDASAFVNKHCNFAEASMMASELGHTNQGMAPTSKHAQQAPQPNADAQNIEASHHRQ